MSRGATARAPDAAVVALATLIAVSAGFATFGVLSAMAQPAQLKARLARVEAVTDRAAKVPRQSGDPSTYLPGAICDTQGPAAADGLSQELAQAAGVAGLTAPKISVSPPDGPDLDGRPTPVLFQLEASGPYDAVLGFLRTLGQSTPQVFADTLDLRSQTSTVSVKLTGRVLCRNPLG